MLLRSLRGGTLKKVSLLKNVQIVIMFVGAATIFLFKVRIRNKHQLYVVASRFNIFLGPRMCK